MPSKFGKAFRDSILFHWYKYIAAHIEPVWWRLGGSSGVPHIVKQRALQEYARDFGLGVLVETGTNYAHMIHVQKNRFREIYSIELDAEKAESARREFAGLSHIHILQGDSGELLPKLLPSLKEPCLFWLDGHDGGHSTPVRQQLGALFRDPIQDHVILLDDALWFRGSGGYPTLEELRQNVDREYPDHVLEIKDEIIRIHKPKPQVPART